MEVGIPARLQSTASLPAPSPLQQLHYHAYRARDAHARLDAWTARKAQWRQDRANGQASGALKPQQNDRPEVSARAAQQAR
jgi:hypothetical protein